MSSRVSCYMTEHHSSKVNPSPYRKGYDTETTLLRIVSADNRCIPYVRRFTRLITKCSYHVYQTGSVFQGQRQTLLRTSQSLEILNVSMLTCGVHQGSFLGPSPFTIYTTGEHRWKIRQRRLGFYVYADDTRLTCDAIYWLEIGDAQVTQTRCIRTLVVMFHSGQCSNKYVPFVNLLVGKSEMLV